MKRLLGVTLLGGALALGACGGGEEAADRAAIDPDVEDRTPHEQQFVTADTSEGYETSAAAPVVPVQGSASPADPAFQGPLTATGNLVGVAQNAPPGTVTVTEAGPGTTVLLKIDRYTSGTTLVASLVRGQCRAPGQTVARVGPPFTIGTQGFATQTASVPVQTRQILDGRHSIRINTPGRDAPEFTLACANLPAVDQPS